MKEHLERRTDNPEFTEVTILVLDRVQNYQNMAQCVHQLIEAGDGGGVGAGV
jgi:hypothetical protein